MQITRVAEWCFVPKLLVVEPLTLKSGMAAPRSPVNNCGKDYMTNGIDIALTELKQVSVALIISKSSEIVESIIEFNGGSAGP